MTTHKAEIRSITSKPCWQKENRLFMHYTIPTRKLVKFKDHKVHKPLNNLDDLSSAIPGLKHVLDSQKGIVFKFLWLFIISCSFCLCFYQIYNRFQFFLSNPINTRITILRNESVKFPSLTVCAPTMGYISLLPVEKLVAKKKNVSVCSLTSIDLLSELSIESLWSMMSMEGLIGRSGIITRQNFIDHQQTEDETTQSTLLTTLGNCTTFSLKKLVPFQGEDCIISTQFNSPPAEFPCKHGGIAALYFIHLDDEDVTYTFSRGYTILLSKSLMVLGLKAKQFRVINRPESPCDSVRAVSHCERKCFENYLKTQIPCRLPFTSLKEIPPCKNETEVHPIMLNVSRLLTSFRYSKDCSCPNRCSETLYSKNLKQTSTSPHQLLQYFMEENVVEDIEEFYSYTAIPFMCDVGGNLGLFLGLCIPTMIDMLQSITVFLYVKIFAVKV